MCDQFTLFAEIEWHIIQSSKFRFNGQEVTSKEYIPGHKIKWNRDFAGPDGRSYTWVGDMYISKLKLNEGSNPLIAKYQRSNKGIIGEKRSAGLEVFEEGYHMLDIIVMTFVYVEKLRKDYETSVYVAAASG
ncbi:hypothetical protein CONPUDRAFT_162187 [Coniophora puteana RWD-64-598 SS2]|uniref:DUF6593 domain-containing protein n=1 Tax=Coniophora puteana (strain RWD-64-598) TaxID=741705 RepID=A0A5M3N1G6_CONPW|nr:uncharacterized protein CONPUDRAFT_162187 [Coniophora puteana RWD-64-598 SS2]EIW84864.1 hypothetical protein CONPUDRAFT_162187 [Coniophora puteana RWD-64-598 SS2]